MRKLNAIVLSGYGINCEMETKQAIEKAGGSATIIHINTLIGRPEMLDEYNFFVIPGGFSFGDDLGSGQVLANKIAMKLKDEIFRFFNNGNLIMGICNGFQVLVKLGLLPYPDLKQRVTLVQNDSGRFEDRWVYLKVNVNSPSVFLRGIEYIKLPVRHGEGKLVFKDDVVKLDVMSNNLYAMQYVNERGMLAGYPYNPNGSEYNIAGLTDPSGRILGLMPHPEAYPTPFHSPTWTSGLDRITGIKIFENAVKYAEDVF